MAVSETERHELYAKLERVIGKEHAETIMSLLPPVGWTDVATKHDVDVLAGRLEAVEAKLEARIDGVEAKIEASESRTGERIMKTALVVNIPTILASFALAFTAVRLG